MSDVPWDGLAEEEVLPARTFAEALLYLRVRGAAALAARRRDERGRVLLEVRALHDGVEKKFTFRLRGLDDADDLHLGGGAPSTLLDPADLVLFAARIERELPTDPSSLDAAALKRAERDLELAAEALLEVTKFIPGGEDTVRVEAITTTAGRWLYDQDPTRFSRASLTEVEARIRTKATAFQEALARLEAP